MNISKQEIDRCAVVKIEGAMTIYETASLREEFLACFENFEGLILNLTDVTDCDTAGIQLLCSAQKTAKNRLKKFAVTGLSESVKQAAVSIGLNPEELFYFIEKV